MYSQPGVGTPLHFNLASKLSRCDIHVLRTRYNPHGIRMLKEIYDKANLKVLG